MILPYRAAASGDPAAPLENGERMRSDEFRRRLEATPDQKGELLDGVVHMAAATRFTLHGRPHTRMSHWLSGYEFETLGVEACVETTIRLDDVQCPQPDLFLLIEPACGGQATLTTDDYVEGPPELVCEISASTQGEDLRDKFQLYHRNGVREYIVWRTPDVLVQRELES
jgi:Uma2 family endonuclease